ncbi:TonB-dependent siderophore receptor [Pacificimonas sp. ICDLI1SI03]
MKSLLVGTSTIVLSVCAQGLYAQEMTASDLRRDGGDTREEEVAEDETIVISGKFQNSLINRLPIEPVELPFSLETIDADTIRERGFINPLDFLETLPNVVRRQTQLLPGGGSYLIRGLYGTVLTDNRPENDSRGAGRRDISQIERIEVIKGPSSILLGPVIPGGVINQVTKAPRPGNFVNLVARGGSFGTYRLEGDANTGALLGSDVFSGRVTLAYEDQQSPQDPEHTETIAVRPVLEASFTDRTRVHASASYTKRDSVPGSVFPVFTDGTVPDEITAETYIGIPGNQSGEDTYLEAEFQHEFLDNLKLVMRGSYQDTNFDYQTSQGAYNYSGGRGFDPGETSAYVYFSEGYRDTNVTYGDAQLVGDFQLFGQRQDWVIGATAQKTKFASFFAFGGVLGIVDITDLEAANYAVPDFSTPLAPFSDTEDELLSTYAEASLRPTDRLTIVAGLRYDDYKRRNLTTGESAPDDHVSLRVGGSYQLVDGLNGYASYAESFIPQTGVQSSGDLIDPETAVNYEIGIKGSLLDGRVNLTAAAFSLTRQNVSTPDPNNVPGGPFFVVATGEQKHEGFEINAGLELTRALSLDLSYGYVDASITEVINSSSGEDVGDPVALVPSQTFSVYGSYTVQEGALSGFRTGLGVRGISERPAPRFGIDYEGYTLVDASIAYPVSESFEVQLNVLNLLDEEYRDSIGFNSGTPAGGHRFGNPRAAYVTLRASL